MAKAKTLWCTQSRTCGEGSGRDSVVCCAPPRAGLVVMAKAKTLLCAVHHPELDLW